jgi:hypothetical protein
VGFSLRKIIILKHWNNDMTCPVYSYVNESRPNHKMAILHIKEVLASCSESSTECVLKNSPYADPEFTGYRIGFVDWFMGKFPRGNGTGGNENLRKIYASCWVIKHAMSRNMRHPIRYKLLNLTAGLKNYICEMRKYPDSYVHTELYGKRQILNKLFELDLITGHCDGRGAFTSYWLTDKGIDCADQNDLNPDGQHYAMVVKGLVPPVASDYERAKVAIRRLLSEDGEAFIEGVKKIVMNF